MAKDWLNKKLLAITNIAKLNKIITSRRVFVSKDLANKNVYSVGRYGAWTYCSMEDCMVEAKELSEKI